MTDITTYPTIVDGIIHNAGPTWGIIIANGSISAGQVVGFLSGSGTTNRVTSMKNAAAETILGVAINNASNGERVTVALPGCIVTVANADDTTGIPAGRYVQTDDAAVGGAVKIASLVAGGANSVTAGENIVGLALENLIGGGTGKILLFPFETPT